MIKLLNRKKENGEVKTELKAIKRPTIVVLIALCIIVLITITLLLLNPGSAGTEMTVCNGRQSPCVG